LIASITAGIILGLSAGLAPGPLLTLVVAQTLKHGMQEGIKVALAPLVTDLPIIAVALLVVANLSQRELILGWIALAGGVYVLYLALECMRTGPVRLALSSARPHSLRKGFIANALNPHPYLFWITVGAPMMVSLGRDHLASAMGFIVCFYLLLVGSKVVLAVLVGKYSQALSSSGYVVAMRLMGVALAGFSIYLFKDAYQYLGIGSLLAS
jgi:threonine/homoserine/homoserine lactone efflux protein